MPEVRRIRLSWRKKPVGGEVSAHPEVSDERALEQAQHLVLLIHGYNNDAADAQKAYDGFHARQRDLGGGERYGIGRTFVEVYWPGDAAWAILSFLFYMGSIRHAIQTAERLAAYLAEHARDGARIDIVAHSMGCRLANELLLALKDRQPPPHIERIVFMAGAVPTFMLEQRDPPRRLRPPYDQVLCEGARSLYSGADSVLSFSFPAGQTLAPGAEGFLPTALGHDKWADPTAPFNLDQQPNDGAKHGDYWGWNTKPEHLQCSERAAQHVRSYLQFPSAGSREIEPRRLAENSALEARANTNPREIETRRAHLKTTH